MEQPEVFPVQWEAPDFYWSIELGYFKSKIWVTHV